MTEILPLIGPTLGVLGFILSCINLWRATHSERQTRTLVLLQKREELIRGALAAQVAIISARRRISNYRRELISSGDDRRIELLDKFSELLDAKLSVLGKVGQELTDSAPTNDTHKEVIRFNKFKATLASSGDPSMIEATTDDFIDSLKQNRDTSEILKKYKADFGELWALEIHLSP